jgi:serine/threonine protein kinase
VTLARIGRFEVERTLGAGTFSTVWLARDEDLDAWVAIKLLAENWSLNQDARRRFIEEARALRRLDNDRIVRVYEVGRLPDGRPYMVMEFADRGTLEDRMRLRASLDQPYSVHEALAASLEIAECLIAVHDLSIVHRDVKPSNVLFKSVSRERQEAMRRDGVAVEAERTLLGDFGIARRLEGSSGRATVVGSPYYMAPEQADPARAHLVDCRSDLYSAAAILYELLAGRLPFGFRSLTEIQGAPQDLAPDPIQDLQPAVSASVSRVVHQGLERDPARRLGSAREWRDALRALLSEDHAPVSVSSRARGEADGGVAVPTVPIALAEPPRPPSPTQPVPKRIGTVALPAQAEPIAPVQPAPSKKGVRGHGAVAALAGLLLFVGAFLPWATVRGGPPGPRGIDQNRLGLAFRGGSVALVAGVILILAGARLWKTRRRWIAILMSLAATLAGLSGLIVALYEAVLIKGRVAGTLTGAQRGLPVVLGTGLLVVLVGGALGLVSGYAALARLRRMRLLERHPLLRVP